MRLQCFQRCLSVCLSVCLLVGRSVGRSVGGSVCLSVNDFVVLQGLVCTLKFIAYVQVESV